MPALGEQRQPGQSRMPPADRSQWRPGHSSRLEALRPTAIRKARTRGPLLLICAFALGATACGEDEFENKPRPPVPIELSGVIKPTRVIVSPDDVGAGPVRITISNQTELAHTVTLEGDSLRERVGPVYPQDTARIQKTLGPGRYELRVTSDDPATTAITPATLTIGRRRPESNNRLLLP